MSIETILTLGVATSILAVAATLHLVSRGAVRLFQVLSGRRVEKAWALEEALPRPAWSERARPVLEGAKALLILVVATLNASAQALAREVMRFPGRLAWCAEQIYAGFSMVVAWVWPRLVVAFRWVSRKVVTAYRWTRPRSVAAAHSMANRSRSGATRTRAWWHRRLVPELHRLAVEEAGAAWPASRVRGLGQGAPDPGAERTIRLDDDGPTLRLIRFDDDELSAREKESA